MTAPALAVIAGAGDLPRRVALSAREQGRRVLVVLLRGAGDPAAFPDFETVTIGVGQVGRLVRTLKAHDISDLCFIGAVIRPDLASLRPDLGLIRRLPGLVAAFRGGDDKLLRYVTELARGEGFRVVSAAEIAPDLMAGTGIVSLRQPGPSERDDARTGLRLIDDLAAHDVGQAVVVAGGRVLAIEAAEGTNAMIDRIRDMRASGRLRLADRTGLLVKAAKRGQDMRMDLPTIGPETVRRVAAAGLSGLCLRAGEVIIAERDETIRLADAHGLVLIVEPRSATS